MALVDNLTSEKEALTALLESEYTTQNLRDSLLERLFHVRSLLGELSGGDTGTGQHPNNAVVTSVAANVGSVSLVAANNSRKLLVLYNRSNQLLALRFGTGDAAFSAGSFTAILPASGFLTVDPAGGAHLAITGIWAAADATGYANITSFS